MLQVAKSLFLKEDTIFTMLNGALLRSDNTLLSEVMANISDEIRALKEEQVVQ